MLVATCRASASRGSTFRPPQLAALSFWVFSISVPQQKVLHDKLAMAQWKRRAAATTRYLADIDLSDQIRF